MLLTARRCTYVIGSSGFMAKEAQVRFTPNRFNSLEQAGLRVPGQTRGSPGEEKLILVIVASCTFGIVNQIPVFRRICDLAGIEEQSTE